MREVTMQIVSRLHSEQAQKPSSHIHLTSFLENHLQGSEVEYMK